LNRNSVLHTGNKVKPVKLHEVFQCFALTNPQVFPLCLSDGTLDATLVKSLEYELRVTVQIE
jgi:hypothetical protein